MTDEDKLDQLLIDTAVLRAQFKHLRDSLAPTQRDHGRRIAALEAKFWRLGGLLVGLAVVTPDVWQWVAQ